MAPHPRPRFSPGLACIFFVSMLREAMGARVVAAVLLISCAAVFLLAWPSSSSPEEDRIHARGQLHLERLEAKIETDCLCPGVPRSPVGATSCRLVCRCVRECSPCVCAAGRGITGNGGLWSAGNPTNKDLLGEKYQPSPAEKGDAAGKSSPPPYVPQLRIPSC